LRSAWQAESLGYKSGIVKVILTKQAATPANRDYLRPRLGMDIAPAAGSLTGIARSVVAPQYENGKLAAESGVAEKTCTS
jgi:hypothetical protein